MNKDENYITLLKDIPLTVEHEIQALSSGGFSSVKILNKWGATYTLKAEI